MKLTSVGINIFGGGFTMGVRRAGFEVLGQWEQCDAGRKTFDLNKKYFGGIPRPLRVSDWNASLGHVNLVYANPPCAPWSAANTRTGQTKELRRADPRLAMTATTMETALTMKPDVFVLESVARAYSIGRAYYDTWAERWLAEGYGVTYFLSDALLHGVASTRERFHFIAHRYDLALREPNMREFMPNTCGMAIADLADHFGHLAHHMPKRMTPRWHGVIDRTPQGELLRGTEGGEKISFLMRRMLWDAPAYTILSLEKHAHPTRPRLLTGRENLRLMGYPDDFCVAEPHAATQAVMPLVGEWLARRAAESLDNPRAQGELELVDWRDLAKPYRARQVMNQMEDGDVI